ncbi:MAG TPA: hypothetical protein VIZ91_06920 [Solirubrobacterales bacterium]
MKSASRTLVKSPPELWELIDQPDRMQGLMCGLLGRATEVTVDERKPESVLRWHAAGDGDQAWIEVELAEKGWGTRVEVSAESPSEPTKLEGWLDAVLEELATPQKRPFESMGDAPQRKAPEREAPPATAPVEAPPAESAVPAAPAEDPRPDRPGKLRRIFGF